MSEEEQSIVLAQPFLSGAIVHGDFANQNEIQSVYLYQNNSNTGTVAFVSYTQGYMAGETKNADVTLTGLNNGIIQISIYINASVYFGTPTEYYLFLNIEE